MNPGAGFAGGISLLVIGLLLSIPITAIIKAWLVDGTLDFGVAMVSIISIMALFGAAWGAQETMLSPLIFILAIGLAVVPLFMPVISGRLHKTSQKQLDDGDIQKFRAAIERDPKNASAYAFLGDALLKRGSVVAAQAQYERAVELAPQAEAWQRKLRDVRMQAERQTLGTSGPSTRILICENCRADNDAALSHCARCNAILPGTAREFMQNRAQQKEILRVSSSAGLMAAGCVAVFSSLPLEWKGCVLMASAIYFAFCCMKNFGN